MSDCVEKCLIRKKIDGNKRESKVKIQTQTQMLTPVKRDVSDGASKSSVLYSLCVCTRQSDNRDNDEQMSQLVYNKNQSATKRTSETKTLIELPLLLYVI